MTVNSGPAPTASPVMHIDSTNITKSWRGSPTTNYISFPEASYNGSSFVNFGYNYANLGATYTYGAGVSNPVNAPGVLQYFTGTTGYKYFSIDSASLPVTGTYTFSYYARITSAGNNNVGNSQLWRANGSDRGVTGDWNPTFTSQWVRYSTTGPAEAGTILQYFPIHSGSITGGCTIEYCGFQLEVGSYATPFVIGSRSSTQAIVDLTGNNLVTATSLTYASDGTYSFNGSTNHLTCGNNTAIAAISGTTAVTVEAWVNLSGYGSSGYGVITHKGNPWAWLMENPGNRMQIRFGLSVSGDVSCADSATHALNTWYHFVGSYDGANMRFYRNGVLTNTTAASGTLGGTGINMVVGNFSGAYYSQGQIPIVKIYNRTLTNLEIQQNFNALRGRYVL